MTDTGIICPNCGVADSCVLDSRRYKDAVKRRRLCDGCGVRFHTIEKPSGSFAREYQKGGKKTNVPKPITGEDRLLDILSKSRPENS